MRLFVESMLPCEAELAWSAVQTSALLLEIAYPLVIFRPVAGEKLPERWAVGSTVRCRLFLFGFLPLGTHMLLFERIDQQACEIQTRESDPLVQRWDHIVCIRPAGEGKCRYSDEIEIEAGWRTRLVWLFASGFYRYRQRRWRRIARRLADSKTNTQSNL
jgi:hypothetical protein